MAKKEFIYVRPHVAKFIEWHEGSTILNLAKKSTITAHITLGITTAEKSAIREDELPPQYSKKIEVIIDLPELIRTNRYYISNFFTIEIDAFCHRLFLDFAALQMDFAEFQNKSRKEARKAYLNRLAIADDIIDEETVRRLVDFMRNNQRLLSRARNNTLAKHINKTNQIKVMPKSVLSLFPV